jgi:hypothetical protein
MSIAYGEVATHNHFVLDRGGKGFKQTAPIIKLPDDASEAPHHELLGLLNSSAVCFWMKQVTEVELVMSHGCSGGPDGQTGLGEAAVYEVAAVLDVP